jgi:N-acetylmuramoyl-L-alanine amidase CwlA
MKYIKAKSISYGAKRSRKDVKAIAFHYTGNDGDTAEGNASFFHRKGDGNTRSAGAQFFIDQKGNVVKSIAMNLTAWAVGDWEGTANGGGSLHGIYKNSNTVSIELCDIAHKDPSKKMIKAVKKTIKYIRKHCPNAKVVCRHWDISGKHCPGRMTGLGNSRWIKFLEDIGETENARPKIEVIPKYPTKNLKIGSQGVQVKSLQKCLNKIDKAGLDVDGDFRGKTGNAVKDFKRKHMGVKHPTDKVGKKTRAKIKELMSK